LLVLYDWFKSILINTKLLDFVFIFQLSAIICSLICNIGWSEGILDYIYLKPLFIFDLKDLYLNINIVLILFLINKNKNLLNTIKGKDLIIHIKNRFKRMKHPAKGGEKVKSMK